MRSATFTLLAAALASFCSAAPTASAVAATALPAKFSLSYVPLSGSALPASGGTIVSNQAYGFSLTLNTPTTRDKTLVNFTGSASSAFVHHPEFTRNFDWYFAMTRGPSGSVHLVIPDDITASVITTGLSDSNGSLVWDLGSGPQSLWGACSSAGEWNLVWAPGAGCVKVDLKIHAL